MAKKTHTHKRAERGYVVRKIKTGKYLWGYRSPKLVKHLKDAFWFNSPREARRELRYLLDSGDLGKSTVDDFEIVKFTSHVVTSYELQSVSKARQRGVEACLTRCSM